MDIYEEIQKLDSLLDGAKKLPGLGMMVDERQVKEALQNIKQSVPIDVKRAEQILSEREELVNQAAREAKNISNAADDEFASKVNVSTMVRAAEKKAKDILAIAQEQAKAVSADAEQEAKARRDETRHYFLEVLQGLETQLVGLEESVRKGVVMLEREIGHAASQGKSSR